MAERATLARPYAKAAFTQAKSEGKTEEWSALLALLATISADPLMRRVAKNPKVSDEQLNDLLAELCASKLMPTGKNFLQLLVQAGRLEVAPQIQAQFERRRLQAEGRANVDVTSAYELDDVQRNRIRELMTRRLGKEVTLTASVDQALIGGAIIRSGDSVIDASVRGRLRTLRNQLNG